MVRGISDYRYILPSESWTTLFEDLLTVKLQIHRFAKFDLGLLTQKILARLFAFEIGLNLRVIAIIVMEKILILNIFFLEIRSQYFG